MKLSKHEVVAFDAAGEPKDEPDYMDAAKALYKTLSPSQEDQLAALLCDFGELVRYERRWYFHMGYLAGKKETNNSTMR